MPATIREILDELEHEAVATRAVLARIPDDRLGWRPHEKSRTLGELAMHVAQLPGGIPEIATWERFDVSIDPPHEGAASTAEVLAHLDRSLAQARARLTALGDHGLAQPWRLVDGDRELLVIPRAQLLRSVLLNHWYHHRGQLTVYLRLVGVPVPAIYGDSADEAPSFA